MAPMALTAAAHIGIGVSPIAAASSCSCSSSCSARPQRRFAPSALSASAVHASGASSVFRDGTELLAAPMRYRTARRPGQLQVVGLFGLGVPELVVIAGVAALLFGPKKLPEIGKSLGKTVKSFQQAAKEFESEVKASAASDAATAAVVEEPKPAPTPVSKPEAPPAAATAAEKDRSA